MNPDCFGWWESRSSSYLPKNNRPLWKGKTYGKKEGEEAENDRGKITCLERYRRNRKAKATKKARKANRY